MSAQRTTTQEVTMAHKITTSFVAEGERTVKVDGEYAGTIARFPREGWKYMGSPKAFRTFTEAAQFTAKRYLARKEAGRVSLVQPGAAVTLRRTADGIETWHRVEHVSVIASVGVWTLLVGGLLAIGRAACGERGCKSV